MFQFWALARPMELAESGAVKMLLPFRGQPGPNCQALERGSEIDTFIFTDAGVSMAADASIALRIWGKIDIVESEQCFRDKKTRAAQVKLGHNRHFQCAAVRAVFEIGTVLRNEQARTEKARLLATQRPGHVSSIRLDPFQNDPVRQKNCEPPIQRNRLGFVLAY